MKNIILILFLLLSTSLAFAVDQDFTIASVGQASKALQHIMVSDLRFGSDVNTAERTIAKKLNDLVAKDFTYYKHKYKVTLSKSGEYVYEKGINHSQLRKKGIDVLVQHHFIKKGKKTFLKIKASDILKKTTLYEKEVSFTIASWRTLAHSIADKVFRELNEGKQSIFKDKIVFVSNHGSTRTTQFKELYIVDFDGERRKRLTYHRGFVISPAVSPDGNKILYSLIDVKTRRKNINLMMLNLITGKITTISDKKGINSGAVFTGDGKSILLTLSFNGNADIYEMRLDNKQLVQITDHRSADVDPSINGRGSQMAFLSDRSGRAMIYSLDLKRAGAQPVRISYVGKFNATPRFSPDGKDIVFSSWLDKGFDIFRIKSSGNELVRLTKDFGSNEEPSFSFDNEFITFSSRRVLSSRSVRDSIYLMTRDGDIVDEVIKGFGECSTPRWLR